MANEKKHLIPDILAWHLTILKYKAVDVEGEMEELGGRWLKWRTSSFEGHSGKFDY